MDFISSIKYDHLLTQTTLVLFGVVRMKLAPVERRVYLYNVSTRGTEVQPLYNTLSAAKLVHFTNI